MQNPFYLIVVYL